MLKTGNTIALVCNSNAQSPEEATTITAIINQCTAQGLHVILSPVLYEENIPFSLCGPQKAAALIECYQNDSITAIMDISGGDLANSVLPYLDYDIIKAHPKPFWGYSDLTTILNAIFQKTGTIGVLYQLKNIIWDKSGIQQKRLKSLLNNDVDSSDLFTPTYHFIKGTSMEGVLIGGNIRCFLKLAGTPYMPDLTDKILLLEGCGGGVAQYATYLSQLLELPNFSKLSGILLGTFSNMEANKLTPTVETMLQTLLTQKDQYHRTLGTQQSMRALSELPIAKTTQIGHGTDSKALIIGKNYYLNSVL